MTDKILIVEDEFIVANDLRIILERSGYQVVGIAGSVPEALEIISQKKPKLVLLDIYLTGKLTGIDLARQLKEMDIAFVYLSANSNRKVLEEAKATEPYGFLVKPFREKDVLVTLDIARYRHENSLESKFRQEAYLQKKLVAIYSESMKWELKGLQLAKALQSFVPFDFLMLSVYDDKRQAQNICSYFRLGFEQYQTIQTKELSVMTARTEAEVQTLLHHAIEDEAAYYDENEFNQLRKVSTLKGLLAQTFQLSAHLVLPLALSGSSFFVLSFYSKRRNVYDANTLDFLKRFLPYLENIAEEHLTPKSGLSSADQEAGRTAFAKAVEKQSHFEGIIGNSHKLLNVLDHVWQVAPLDTSVLILGESGTGKEKIAQAIHQLSSRKHKPLIKVNCAALPTNLIESELFGHEKGAFTGAIDRRLGKFEQANEGSIFLDEIGEMPIEMQVKLLRVLQEKEIERIGGKGPMKVDVRIIAATNRNLEKEVAEGRFRLDLYYRLNVFPLTLPPLRERTDDIRLLAQYFAEQFCKRFNKVFNGISDQMLKSMESYYWPGNIRELENIIEQSVILNDGRSELKLMRSLNNALFTGNSQENNSSLNEPVNTLEDVKKIQEDTERKYIVSVLRQTQGRIRGVGGAAELLNLKPTTLESRIARLGISKEDI